MIATLLADDSVAAEAAVARLAIVGRASVRYVLEALPGASATQAVRLLNVLERIGDPLALPTLSTAVDDSRAEVAEAAVGALTALLASPRAPIATAALDRLTALTLDVTRPVPVRLASLEALVGLDLEVVAVVRAQLLTDADDAVRAAARQSPASSAVKQTPTAPKLPVSDVIRSAVDGHLPTEPDVLRHALATTGDASLSDLHRVIQRLREEERRTPQAAAAWQVARAAAHQALAARGSRLAVYDLRETIEQLGAATPVGILSALQDVGDAAALEAIADTWSSSEDAWFKGQLGAAFAAIVRREGLTRRHGVVRKLSQRIPQAVDALWPARQ